MSTDYEKLGVFYLGREYDPAANALKDDLVLYDSKDLTHAVCVGMTGSGKTGLCLGLLEEAAIDGIPAICIDPKGDLGNLLLTFPNLAPEDFEPWIDAGDARARRRAPRSPPRRPPSSGRRDWPSGARRPTASRSCRRGRRGHLHARRRRRPAAVGLRSFAPPPPLLPIPRAARPRHPRPGLLGLLGIDADPVRSASTSSSPHCRPCLARWTLPRHRRHDPGHPKPAFEKIGALDLETFFPAKDRFELAMRSTTCSPRPASPPGRGRAARRPEPALHARGKPRMSIISIAHLNDAERMFFVTLLLNELIAWMRASRAPRLCAPSSTWTKSSATSRRRQSAFQDAHAHAAQTGARFRPGLRAGHAESGGSRLQGSVNCGTWFIGRLQTERDKCASSKD